MDRTFGDYQENMRTDHRSENYRRIGIMGGSFDPIHLGHLEMAEYAYHAMGLHTVLFIPLGDPPHKGDTSLACAVHRKNMVELAIQGYDHFALNDLELRRDGYTYTADTLLELRKTYPLLVELDYLLGADAFLYIRKWYNFPKVLDMATYVVFRRFDEHDEEIEREAVLLREKYGANILLFPYRPLTVSSTFIRESVRERRGLCGLLPQKVESYIHQWGLYQDDA